MSGGKENYCIFYKSGDENAFAEIIKEYRDGLIFYINGIVCNLQIAEEIAEDTFVLLYVKKPKDKGAGSFKTWLYTIGRNRAYNYLKSKPNGKGNMMCYPNDTAPLSISNYLDQNEFFIDYNDTSRGITFSLYVQGKDISNVSFIKGSTRAYYTIKNSEFCSQSKIVFDEFYTNEESPLDKDTFATECALLIDEYMFKAQNDIFYPKMNLTLSDFGFTKYN